MKINDCFRCFFVQIELKVEEAQSKLNLVKGMPMILKVYVYKDKGKMGGKTLLLCLFDSLYLRMYKTINFLSVN